MPNDQEPPEKKKGIKWVKGIKDKLDSLKLGEKVKVKSRNITLNSLESRGENQERKGNTYEAIDAYRRAAAIYRGQGDSLEVARLFNHIASLHNDLGNAFEAGHFMDLAAAAQGIVLNEEPIIVPDLPDSLFSELAPEMAAAGVREPKTKDTLKAEGRFSPLPSKAQQQHSENYLEKYRLLALQLREAEKNHRADSLAQAIMMHQTINEQKRDIELLHQKQQIQLLEMEKQAAELEAAIRFRRSLYIFIGLIIALAGLLYVLFFTKKKANRELQSANKELAQTLHKLKSTQTKLVESEKMASLGLLTAGIAHEINNPVNFISGNIAPLRTDIDELLTLLNLYEVTVSEHQLDETFKEVNALKEDIDLDYLKTEIQTLLVGIGEGVDRTTEIIKGLRDFSRLDELEIKSFDLHSGLDSTLTLLRKNYQDKIEIVKNYGSLPTIEGYPGKINQVFMNILSNAIQAIPDKGKITLTSEEIANPNNDSSDIKDWVQLTIADTGAGIPEEIMSKIFEPFFTTKDVGEGTGLGLAISLGIIEQHNGTINYASEEGKGTTVTIYLPQRQEA